MLLNRIVYMFYDILSSKMMGKPGAYPPLLLCRLISYIAPVTQASNSDKPHRRQ